MRPLLQYFQTANVMKLSILGRQASWSRVVLENFLGKISYDFELVILNSYYIFGILVLACAY